MSENQNNNRNRSNSDRFADNDRRTRRRRNAVVEMDPSYIPSEFEIQGDPVLEHADGADVMKLGSGRVGSVARSLNVVFFDQARVPLNGLGVESRHGVCSLC